MAEHRGLPKPSSATIVRRFLQFRGAGPKIATMAANILVRDFKIPVSDRYSIDISADVHVRRVFTRLRLIGRDASDEELIYRARELNPAYPGVFDLPIWGGRPILVPTSGARLRALLRPPGLSDGAGEVTGHRGGMREKLVRPADVTAIAQRGARHHRVRPVAPTARRVQARSGTGGRVRTGGRRPSQVAPIGRAWRLHEPVAERARCLPGGPERRTPLLHRDMGVARNHASAGGGGRLHSAAQLLAGDRIR
ncbi:MAG: hypothetical protein U0821_17160 [Chloroflexota bacterium]